MATPSLGMLAYLCNCAGALDVIHSVEMDIFGCEACW